MDEKKKKGKGKWVILLLILCLLAGVGSYAYVNKTAKDGEVTIDAGSGTIAIANQLKEQGLIRSKTAFLIMVQFSEYKGRLQYGTYLIEKGTSMAELIRNMATQGAKEETIKVTVPEGYSVEQIAQRVEDKGLCSADDFLAACDSKDDYDLDWLSDIEENDDRYYLLQGYLYPDTYDFYKDATAQDMVLEMLENFEKHYSELDTDLPMDRLVTEASVIEKETSVDSERATIAGVIENRMAKNMKLQIDATALYPLTGGLYDQEEVSYADLKVDSPYNTYVTEGLPAGPICNPSIESIEAAANPEEHEYLYYHTKEDGSKEHSFYKTYKEHVSSQN